ncbi:MAG: ankyrin repeat domain-containing protein [Chlamydiales bacterium]
MYFDSNTNFKIHSNSFSIVQEEERSSSSDSNVEKLNKIKEILQKGLKQEVDPSLSPAALSKKLRHHANSIYHSQNEEDLDAKKLFTEINAFARVRKFFPKEHNLKIFNYCATLIAKIEDRENYKMILNAIACISEDRRESTLAIVIPMLGDNDKASDVAALLEAIHRVRVHEMEEVKSIANSLINANYGASDKYKIFELINSFPTMEDAKDTLAKIMPLIKESDSAQTKILIIKKLQFYTESEIKIYVDAATLLIRDDDCEETRASVIKALFSIQINQIEETVNNILPLANEDDKARIFLAFRGLYGNIEAASLLIRDYDTTQDRISIIQEASIISLNKIKTILKENQKNGNIFIGENASAKYRISFIQQLEFTSKDDLLNVLNSVLYLFISMSPRMYMSSSEENRLTLLETVNSIPKNQYKSVVDLTTGIIDSENDDIEDLISILKEAISIREDIRERVTDGAQFLIKGNQYSIKERISIIRGFIEKKHFFSTVNSELFFEAMDQIPEGKRKDIIDILIQENFTITKEILPEDTLLHIAIRNNHSEVAMKLIGMQMGLNDANEQGQTPLHEAAIQNQPRIVEALLANGANKVVVDKLGLSPQRYAEGRFDSSKSGLVNELRDYTIQVSPLEQMRWWLVFTFNAPYREFEGMNVDEILDELTNFYEKFLDENKDIDQLPPAFTQENRKKSLEILQESFETVLVNDSSDLFQKYQNNTTLMLQTGWIKPTHATVVVISGNTLYRCNRGYTSLKINPGIEVFKITKPEAMSPAIFEKLIKAEDQAFVERDIDEILGLERTEHIDMQPQKIGNCGWASAKAGLLALLHTFIPNLNTAKEIYKRFTSEHRYDVLKRAVELFHDLKQMTYFDRDLMGYARDKFMANKHISQSKKDEINSMVEELLASKNISRI